MVNGNGVNGNDAQDRAMNRSRMNGNVAQN